MMNFLTPSNYIIDITTSLLKSGNQTALSYLARVEHFPFGCVDRWTASYDQWDDQAVMARAFCLSRGYINPPSTGGHPERYDRYREDTNRTVFIGGLEGRFTAEEVAAVVEYFGELNEPVRLTAKGKSAIAGFTDNAAAERALSHLQAFAWRGTEFRVSYAYPNPKTTPSLSTVALPFVDDLSGTPSSLSSAPMGGPLSPPSVCLPLETEGDRIVGPFRRIYALCGVIQPPKKGTTDRSMWGRSGQVAMTR